MITKFFLIVKIYYTYYTTITGNIKLRIFDIGYKLPLFI